VAEIKEQIQTTINFRLEEQKATCDDDPFGDDGVVRVLLIGLDSRLGSEIGHCDAIQMIEIDRDKQTVAITAVPRGTYVPLPGSGHLSSDYYISKSCEIGGLDYGIEQIEKILGAKADYVVVVGFSEALGIFRTLDLPTTETLQWLRLRQGYAVGEPQRAHNHSTFLKDLLVRFVPDDPSSLDAAWEYLLYQFVDTDLSFAQARNIVAALSEMNLPENSEKITLLMKPAYIVADVAYDPERLDEYISSLVDPVAAWIPEGAYSGISDEEAQQRLMDLINSELENPEFVSRAFEQKLWLQIEDSGTRESVHFAILEKYLDQVFDFEEAKNILADYIIEMETLGETEWAIAGRDLLRQKTEMY
jgi:hypothetical protein